MANATPANPIRVPAGVPREQLISFQQLAQHHHAKLPHLSAVASGASAGTIRLKLNALLSAMVTVGYMEEA